MAKNIIIGPGGVDSSITNKVMVGNGFTGDLATFNGKIFIFTDPYNPLDLPSNTIRVRTNDGNAPIIKAGSTQHATYDTAILVEGTNDVYDVYKSGTSFEGILYYSINVVEVLGANTTGITNMRDMFKNCDGLTTVSIFDTSDVTIMRAMFHNCPHLPSVPLFNTTNATDMSYMFEFCGALTTIPLFDTTNVTTMDDMFGSFSASTNDIKEPKCGNYVGSIVESDGNLSIFVDDKIVNKHSL